MEMSTSNHEYILIVLLSLSFVGAACSSASSKRCRASATPSLRNRTHELIEGHVGRETNPRAYVKFTLLYNEILEYSL